MKDASAVELFRICTAGDRDNRAWGEFVLRFQPRLRANVARALRRLDQRASPKPSTTWSRTSTAACSSAGLRRSAARTRAR